MDLLYIISHPKFIVSTTHILERLELSHIPVYFSLSVKSPKAPGRLN